MTVESALARFRRECSARNYDPLHELITLAQDEDATRAEKIRIAEVLMKRAYPELRSVDMTSAGEPIRVVIDAADATL